MKLLFLLLLAFQHTYPFKGAVVSIDPAAHRIAIRNEPIPGGMGAMVMQYKIEPESLYNVLKPGDVITADYNEDDSTLRNVKIQPKQPAPPPKPGLTLPEVEQLALKSSPTLLQAQANIESAVGHAEQSGLFPNPTAGYYSDEVRGGSYGGGKQGAYFTQTIPTAGKLQAARQLATTRRQQATTTAEIERARFLSGIRSLFYQTLAAQRLVEVRQDLSKLAADAAETAHQLANVGQADRPDVLQAELEQQQAALQLQLARQDLASSRRILAAAAGQPTLPDSPLQADLEALPNLNYDQWLSTALARSPQIRLAQQSTAQAEAALTQARKAPIPDLQLSANLSQNNELLENTHRPTGLTGGVQLGVELPLFNRNQGNIAAAKADLASARQEPLRAQLELTRAAATLFRDYESARATAAQYKSELLPRAEQSYQLYSTNYRAMAGPYNQSLQAQRTLFQLQTDYIHALAQAWQSALALQALME